MTIDARFIGRVIGAYLSPDRIRANLAPASQLLHSNITPVGNVGSGTDDLMSYTLPADILHRNGQALRITAWGDCAANDNDKTRALLFGGTSIWSSGAIDSNDIPWMVQAVLIRLSATTQLAIAAAIGQIGDAGDSYTNVAIRTALTKTLSDEQIIKMTGVGTSNDDILQEGILIELLNGGI